MKKCVTSKHLQLSLPLQTLHLSTYSGSTQGMRKNILFKNLLWLWCQFQLQWVCSCCPSEMMNAAYPSMPRCYICVKTCLTVMCSVMECRFTLHAWDCGAFAVACCVSTFTQEQPREIIKPVPITQPAPSTPNTSAKPSNQPSPAYNKTARPFGGGSCGSVTGSPSLAAPKVASIPSESSAFTPAAPSQPPQPPFPLKSSIAAPDPAPATSSRVSKPNPTTQAVSSASPKSSAPTQAPVPSSHPSVPQSSVYNTPIKLYSNANACEVAIGQRRGLLESQGLSEHLNG